MGYDPATAATMVGAVRDKITRVFSPPPLFALSPRMIVTNEKKRREMKQTLVAFLNVRAEYAEQQLLLELELEEGLKEIKKSKNASKNAKKSKLFIACTICFNCICTHLSTFSSSRGQAEGKETTAAS
jgi:hypothetical protein